MRGCFGWSRVRDHPRSKTLDASPTSGLVLLYAAFNSDVQLAQRVALMATVE
jgi:hypothetical protein